MKIRLITLFAVALAMVTMIGALYVYSEWTLQGTLSKLEERDARQRVSILHDAAARELELLKDRLTDWSNWDDCYNYVQDRNQAFEKANLENVVLGQLKLNLISFVDANGHIVWSAQGNFRDNTYRPLDEDVKNYILSHHPTLLFSENDKKPRSFIMTFERNVILLTTQPILPTNGEGPIRGVLIAGREFDQNLVHRLAGLTHFDLDFVRADRASLSAELSTAQAKLSKSNGIVTMPMSPKVLAAYTRIRDYEGRPALYALIRVPREVERLGSIAIKEILAGIVGIGLLTALFIVFAVDWLALRRPANTFNQSVPMETSSDFAILMEPEVVAEESVEEPTEESEPQQTDSTPEQAEAIVSVESELATNVSSEVTPESDAALVVATATETDGEPEGAPDKGNVVELTASAEPPLEAKEQETVEPTTLARASGE